MISKNLINDVEPKEIGYTSLLVTEICDTFRLNKKIGIWARESKFESKTGADIDLFFEVTKGKFVWIVLQAKTLKLSGKYDSMCHNNQWDKLVNLSENMTCVAYYLLYNGSKNFKYKGKDICERDFNETQFGCSIVNVNTVKNKSMASGTCKAPSFEDFHPKSAQPWRILACCKKYLGYRNYNLYDIKRYVDPYELKTNFISEEMEDIELMSAAIGDDISSLNYFADENNYKSDVVIMIRK